MSKVLLYDTTLRDGSQGANVSFTSQEKLQIAHRLDQFGVHYVEGGWPGSNPRDMEFFELAKRAPLTYAKLTAFSSTRRPGIVVEDDQNLATLLAAGTPAVAIFGKSWDMHVEKTLGTTLDENLAMIRESVAFVKAQGREVIYDAEQFFDGYKNNRDYALLTLSAALEAGADNITLCDTNGGSLPEDVFEITRDVLAVFEGSHADGNESGPSLRWGIHTHNDCGLAVANSLAALRAGVGLVQGTINGYGERTGNADLTTIIPILCVKMGIPAVSEQNLRELTNLARFVSAAANMTPNNARPFVGKNAFAHKAGVHVNAILKVSESYEHMDPEIVGNNRRVLVSDLSGKSNVEFKAQDLGFELSESGLDSRAVVTEVKRLEQEGFQFDVAEGSFKLLLDRLANKNRPTFELDSFRITVEKDRNGRCSSHAIVKVMVHDDIEITASDGQDPVKVLESALRKALATHYPEVSEVRTLDVNVRMLPGGNGQSHRSRVLIEATDGDNRWSTMGISENVIEASWNALVESIQYKISKNVSAGLEDPVLVGNQA